MRPVRKPFLALLTLATLLVAGPLLADSQGDREIRYLLDYIEKSGCTFIRNGEEHSAVKAREHMEYKYGFGKLWIDDGDDFIKRIATESSTTGEKYTIRCDGKTEYTADWLRDELARYRAAPRSVR